VNLPDVFNVATHFVDRHIGEGRGAKVAIECGDERVTFQQLLERVNRIGSALRDHLGVRQEERVALLLLDTPDFTSSFFGAIKIGAVPVPINTLWKTAEYRYVFNDSRARVLMISEPLLAEFHKIPRAELPHLEHVVVVGGSGGDLTLADLIARGSPNLSAAPTSKDEAAFWLYSSGSTGAPKGCVHLHHDMMVCAESFAQGVLGIREDDRCYSVPKLFFAYGIGNGMYFPLAVGATSILFPGPPLPANVYSMIEAHRPTLFFSVPTGYAMMLSHQPPGPDFDLSTVRLAVSAGESLPAALYERFKARFGVDIIDGIGSTETLHMFIANRPGAIRPGSSGVMVPGYEARILDDDGQPVKQGETGHLYIKGDSICSCYWNQHEKTKATITGEWIRTGDTYYQDEDGYFWHGGRSDDMLKVGGLWVSPTEVEHVLIEHPSVQECAVIAREDKDGLVKPHACVVLRAGVSGDDDLAVALQGFVRQKLADYKRPRWVEFVPELPKTATGKIQRYQLRDRLIARG
jgi:benzoate-CoA ligase